MTHDNILSDIKLSSPVLIVYPTGTGGEHIAHTMSICSEKFQSLETYYNKKVNQFHTTCFINYSSDIIDLENFNCSIHESYTEDYKIKNLRLIFKDHPTQRTLEFYKKYLPDITVFFITPHVKHKYFANLAFKKLAKKVKSENIDIDFITSNIVKNINIDEAEFIINEVKQFDWVWVHEIHNLVTDMRKIDNKCPKLIHSDDIKKIVNDHSLYLLNISNEILPEYKSSFKNFHLLNCDDLRSDSLKFWKSIQRVEDSINIKKAVAITNKWIENNNKLADPFDKFFI